MSSDVIAALSGAVVGAFLALLLELIRYRLIERPRALRELVPAVRAEIIDVYKRAVMVATTLHSNRGTLGNDELRWAVENLEPLDDDEARKYAVGLRELLAQRTAASPPVGANLGRRTEDRVSSIPNLEMPFLDAQMHRIGLFPVASQLKLLRVRTEVRLFNRLSDDLREFLAVTFNTSDPNHKLAIGNVRGTERQIIVRAQELARTAKQFL